MTAVDRITDIVTERMRTDGWTCEYHEPTSREGECSGCDESLTRTARSVAAVIAGADDLAVVELPKPDVGIDSLAAFSDGSAAGSVVADTGTVYGAGWEWTPDQAVDVGRQWVAAGRWAARAAAEAVDRGDN